MSTATTETETPSHTFYDLEVTPAIAGEMLKRNPKNRALSPFVVKVISGQMERGLWHYDGSPIRRDKQGNLLDGQHRLNAIVASGQTQTLHIIDGLDAATQITMDTGRKRSFADTLYMEGERVPKMQASITMAAYRWVMLGSRNASLFAGRGQHDALTLQRNELLEFHNADKEAFEEAATYAASMRHILPVPPRVMGMLAWLVLKSESDKSDSFLESLKYGSGLEKGSPVLALRNQFILAHGETNSQEAYKLLGLGVRAWNAYVAEKNVHSLRAPAEIPEPA